MFTDSKMQPLLVGKSQSCFSSSPRLLIIFLCFLIVLFINKHNSKRAKFPRKRLEKTIGGNQPPTATTSLEQDGNSQGGDLLVSQSTPDNYDSQSTDLSGQAVSPEMNSNPDTGSNLDDWRLVSTNPHEIAQDADRSNSDTPMPSMLASLQSDVPSSSAADAMKPPDRDFDVPSLPSSLPQNNPSIEYSPYSVVIKPGPPKYDITDTKTLINKLSRQSSIASNLDAEDGDNLRPDTTSLSSLSSPIPNVRSNYQSLIDDGAGIQPASPVPHLPSSTTSYTGKSTTPRLVNPHYLYSRLQPDRDEILMQMQQNAKKSPPEDDRTSCGDPVNGYEKLVNSCGEEEYEQNFFRIPMVVDRERKCKKKECGVRDKMECCQKRRTCKLYDHDVLLGCPYGRSINPYEYAFCKTIPCTRDDADTCCIFVEMRQIDHEFLFANIWERSDPSQSKRPRVAPNRRSQYVEPPIQFNHGDWAWFDMGRKIAVDGDEWAPLVNFMSGWGKRYGWKTDAWMKVKKRNEMKYKQVRYGQLYSVVGAANELHGIVP